MVDQLFHKEYTIKKFVSFLEFCDFNYSVLHTKFAGNKAYSKFTKESNAAHEKGKIDEWMAAAKNSTIVYVTKDVYDRADFGDLNSASAEAHGVSLTKFRNKLDKSEEMLPCWMFICALHDCPEKYILGCYGWRTRAGFEDHFKLFYSIEQCNGSSKNAPTRSVILELHAQNRWWNI